MKNILLKQILLYICIFNLQFSTFAQDGAYLINMSELKTNLEKIKSGDINYQNAYNGLISEAKNSLKFGPVSVMEKTKH